MTKGTLDEASERNAGPRHWNAGEERRAIPDRRVTAQPWDGQERRQQERRREIEEAADARLIWAEKHLGPIVGRQLKGVEERIAASFEAALSKVLGDVPARVTALEKGRLSLFLCCILGSMLASGALMFIGKMGGWWR